MGHQPNAPYVTVILPTYNRADLLPRAISSVLSQTFRDFELLIIDDGSTDHTREVVATYLDDPRVRFLELPSNAGVAAARNVGIRESAGTYLAFLDSDDEWLDEYLSVQAARTKGWSEPEAVLYQTQAYYRRPSGESINPTRVMKTGETFADYYFTGGNAPMVTLLVARSLAKRVMFNESLPSSVDAIFIHELVLAGGRWELLCEPLSIVHTDATGGRVTGSLAYEPLAEWLERNKHTMSQGAYARFVVQRLAMKALARGHRITGYKWFFYGVWHRQATWHHWKLAMYRLFFKKKV